MADLKTILKYVENLPSDAQERIVGMLADAVGSEFKKAQLELKKGARSARVGDRAVSRRGTVNNRFAEWGAQDNRTWEQVAKGLKVSPMSVSAWKLGKSKPRRRMRERIAKFTNGKVPVESWD